MRENEARILLTAHERDCKFLEELGVFDYSLLIGIHEWSVTAVAVVVTVVVVVVLLLLVLLVVLSLGGCPAAFAAVVACAAPAASAAAAYGGNGGVCTALSPSGSPLGSFV